jgi:DNA-binding transcriptional LysR family regulator
VNSRESLVGMIAAGHEIFLGPEILGPEIGVGSQTAAIDFYRLNEGEIQFELFTIWKRQSEGTPTIDKFIELLQESIKDSGVI